MHQLLFCQWERKQPACLTLVKIGLCKNLKKFGFVLNITLVLICISLIIREVEHLCQAPVQKTLLC